MRCTVLKWSKVMSWLKPKEMLQNYVIIFLWEVIYVHFYNWDRPLDLVLVVYDLIELIIKASLWTKDYSTFDTHTQHTRLLFNECSNVMCILNWLSIKPKKIFKYFICFWKCFYAFVFWVFVQIALFMFFIKNSFRGIFAKSSRVSSSHENGLGKGWKHQTSDRNSCDCFATKGYPQKFLCSRGIFRK